MDKDNLLRVTQINAIFLDNEIYKALLQVVQDISRFFPVLLIIAIFGTLFYELYLFLAWIYSPI